MNKYLVILFTSCCIISRSYSQSIYDGPGNDGGNKNKKSFSWKRATPESVGVSSEKLKRMDKILKEKGTKRLVIIKNDKIIYESYAPGFDAPSSKHYCASMSKSLVSGMSLLAALDGKYIFPDAPACQYISQWKNDERKSKITIRQLATHTSGIEDAEVSLEERLSLAKKGLSSHMDLSGWKGQFWKMNPDPFSVSRDSAALLIERPGSKYLYSNPGIAMLGYAVTQSIQGSPYKDIREFLEKKIYEPIGLMKDDCEIGYGQTFEVDDLQLVPGWGGGSFSINAISRIARLMLRKGNWEGRQIIDSNWVERVIKYEGTAIPDPVNNRPLTPASTMGWYSNAMGTWKYIPRDAFTAAGAGNQMLLIVPSLQLIVIRNGDVMYDASNGDGEFWSATLKYLFNPVINAIEEPPYPKSTLIKDVQFAPPNEILHMAEGSDNWPLTWGDDDLLYTAYGDGSGFDPGVDINLSLGLARIKGNPPAISGENIRSPSAERVGYDVMGGKASGLLMIDGILYMLIRNVGSSQLGWSKDHGKTWEWADWRFDFGCPTFLNYGQNYSDSRDEYVYIYSHHESSAYKIADDMILARVEKNNLRDIKQYEYFSGTTISGKPIWSCSIQHAKPVFTNPGKCFRSGISYNKGLKRYIWTQIIETPEDSDGNDRDGRYQGGMGIFEAPEPWGPWSTAYYTLNWDIGPGETGSIPVKWISKDGQQAYYVFSGEDYFAVRKVIFNLFK